MFVLQGKHTDKPPRPVTVRVRIFTVILALSSFSYTLSVTIITSIYMGNAETPILSIRHTAHRHSAHPSSRCSHKAVANGCDLLSPLVGSPTGRDQRLSAIANIKQHDPVVADSLIDDTVHKAPLGEGPLLRSGDKHFTVGLVTPTAEPLPLLVPFIYTIYGII
jgi:hypothetical protein